MGLGRHRPRRIPISSPERKPNPTSGLKPLSFTFVEADVSAQGDLRRSRFRILHCFGPLTVGVACNTLSCMAVRRSSRVLTVSVPPETAEDFEQIADEEGRNKSELFREMLRVYRTWRKTERFESLQRYGAARARRLGIKSEKDVERLIQELRRG